MIAIRRFSLLFMLCSLMLASCADDPSVPPAPIPAEDVSEQDTSEPDPDPEDTEEEPPEPEDVPEAEPDAPADVAIDAPEDIEDEPEDVPEAEPDAPVDAAEDVPEDLGVDAAPDVLAEVGLDVVDDVALDADPEPEPEPDPPVVVRGLDGRCEGEEALVEPLDESCTPADPDNLGGFTRCVAGSGAFGQWTTDESGLPAYDYTMAQAVDERAVWRRSDDRPRRDHWFALGNDRTIATANNDGFVQLFNRERGPAWANVVDLARGRTGGGYSYLVEGDGEVWASAYRLRPCGDVGAVRRFGIAHALYETTYRGLEVKHVIHAPFGDGAFLIDEVTITNTRQTPRQVRHYEFWDVNRHPLEFQLGRSGLFDPNVLDDLDLLRSEVNQDFEIEVSVEPGRGAALVRHTYTGNAPAPARGAPSGRDFYPADIALVRLFPSPDEVPLRIHTDRGAFFGQGDTRQPEAAALGADPAALPSGSAFEQPALLVDEVALDLAPGQSRTLRYAYGTLPEGIGLEDLDRWRGPEVDLEAERRDAWSGRLAHVATPEAPFLHREMAWHSAALMQASVKEDYFDAHTIIQGSNYLFGHGFDGAARDFALAGVPLAYLRPEQTREALRTIMRTTYENNQISYIIQGFGVLEDAFIHNEPSDLDLHFLWTLVEYIAATGDRAFLDDTSPFWPREVDPDATALDHARRALTHLIDTVGTGPHGLVRLGTGDWNDVLVAQAEDRQEAVLRGESVYNTQMALWVVPRAAALVEEADPALAQRARIWAQGLRAPLADMWLGEWFRRAWLGPNDPFGEDFITLDGQIWGLIAESATPEQLTLLKDAVRRLLDDPSPSGALFIEGDMTWHVLSALLTWGYGRVDAELAWRHLSRHTMTTYARQNPAQWFGIWSGPDALFPSGGTWATEASAMADYPVMNSLQHAMPLLAVLRTAGLEPREDGDGLTLDPVSFERPLAMQWPLLDLSIGPDGIRGTYKALAEGATAIHIRLPSPDAIASVNGEVLTIPEGASHVRVPLTFSPGDRIDFEVVLP